MNPLASRIRGLYGVADAGFRPDLPMEAKVRVFLEGGASVIQLRMKNSPARVLLSETQKAVALAEGRALVFVNDRPDVAVAAGADGVHVGDEDLPVAEIRRIFGDRLLIGATVRTLEEARQAARDGADYVGFGPVFPTRTKTVEAEVRGLDRLAETAGGSPIPVVAIAGMTVERAAEVARAGAAAAAVVSDILGAPDMVGRARMFLDVFEQGERSRA